jgi:hypothetical protein
VPKKSCLVILKTFCFLFEYYNELIFAVDTPEVGLTEELIPEMPEMQLEENVIEESYEIPPGNISLKIINSYIHTFSQ